MIIANPRGRGVPPTTGINSSNYTGNFEEFLKQCPKGSPWVFWYGGKEPHRDYEYGSGVKKGGKRLEDIDKVPSFWPDNDTVRNDLLDYAYEVEYFDSHLMRMIRLLEKNGELKNTIIIVTADNGMPFPRCKGLEYEYSNHLPLAIMWPEGIKNSGRTDNSLISFIDFAPTFIQLAGIKKDDCKMQMYGRNMEDIFNDDPKNDRSYILLGQERHDYGRPLNQGYPIRSIIENRFIYLYNFKPFLWPVGNPETGYLNTDGSPTKSYILNQHRQGADTTYWSLNFGYHPQEELFDLKTDKECISNLANNPKYRIMKEKMKVKLFEQLRKQNDPRVTGNGDIFDSYPFAKESGDNFYERFIKGEIKKYQTDWVNPTDYEKIKNN